MLHTHILSWKTAKFSLTEIFSREISSLFKQATMAGAKPQPEERSLFKKNRDILTLNQPPSSTYLGMVWKKIVLIRGVFSICSPILQQFRRYHYFHLLIRRSLKGQKCAKCVPKFPHFAAISLLSLFPPCIERERVPQSAAIWLLSLFPPSTEESPPNCSNFAVFTISTFYTRESPKT